MSITPTDGQSVDVQVRQPKAAGCKTVFREVASGAKTDRAQLRRLLGQLDDGNVLMVTRLDRLARSVEHPRGDHRQEGRFSILGRRMGRHHHIARAADADRARRAGGVRARPDQNPDRRRPGAGCRPGAENGPAAQAHPAPAARGDQTPRQGPGTCRHWPQLQRQRRDDFPADITTVTLSYSR
jgi:hypothetical protein